MLKSISAVKFIEPRKLPLDFLLGLCLKCKGPHSLGTLIEWKPKKSGGAAPASRHVPTRWGH